MVAVFQRGGTKQSRVQRLFFNGELPAPQYNRLEVVKLRCSVTYALKSNITHVVS